MEGTELVSDQVVHQNSQKMDKPNQSDKEQKVSFFGLFSAADKLDCCLMLFGSVGAAIHGAAVPVFFILFGRLLNSLGHLSENPHKLSSKVSQNALYLVYLGILVLASAWIGVAFWMQTGERQTARLRLKYLQSVLKKDMTFFDTEARDANIIFHISSDAILVQDAIGDKTGHTIRYLSQFLVGFGVGFASVWQLTLLTLAVVPLIAVAGGAYTVIMSKLSEKGEAAYADAGKVAEEVISQIRAVYSFVGEDRAIEAYSRNLKGALKLGKKFGIAKGVGVGFTYGFLFCCWALLLWYASILVRHRITNGAKAFTVIINVIYSGFALGQAAPNIAAIAKGQVAAANIMNMIETDSKPLKGSEDGIVFPKVDGNIEFCEVRFAYPSRPNMVFENLSFSLTAGKTFAVVGPSGSGKSTVISMVQRFYEPISGKILLDGHDLKTLQTKWLRQQMGLVSQEPALFATTIADNILFGKEDANMDQIVQAAKVANAHSFVEQLPNGYHTQVGEGGTQLSGGQKQRIAIARAVLRNPKILLLDEATSALDSESELIVQQALDRIMSNRTTIIVAHRLSTIREVDSIVVLKNGQVVESGNHLDLISKGGEYAALLNLQVSEHLTRSDSLAHSESVGNSSFRELPDGQNQEGREMQQSKSNFKPKPSIWELLKLNAPEWPYAVLGSVGAILAGMEAPIFALGISHILTALYNPDASEMKHEVLRMAFIFIGLGVVTIPIYLLQHYFYTLMGERLTTRVRLSMFSAILCNEIGWFDSDVNSTGSLTSALAAEATTVRSALADRLSTIVQNIALTQLFLKGFGGDYAAYSRATSLAREAISNIRTVASFGAEERIAIQFATELSKPNKQALVRGHISGFGYGLSQCLCYAAYALGLWYASVLIRHKESNFGSIIKSFMVLIITAFSVAETLALTPDIVKGSQALDSVFRILHRKTVIDPNNPESKVVSDIKGDIEFRNVNFNYPARPDIVIFDNLNLKVSAGKSLAVVGQSGSGKSTVIALILRFYDPTFGRVLIDGSDLKTLNLKSLRLRIGLVQQEPALFSTTIYENIKYGNEAASEIEVMEAAKAANAHDFISRMPEGYQTDVGDRGVQLSGGQKQRVAIARAILKDPSILLLDEATSALDSESEKLVQEALDKLMQGRTTVVVAHRGVQLSGGQKQRVAIARAILKDPSILLLDEATSALDSESEKLVQEALDKLMQGRTTVVVAHRLSTVREADRIAVLQFGRVVEMGSHRQLIGKPDGVYKQLVSLQQEKST
ncbi:ABC transporter B member 14 [Turnera subulata]|uniref:ABC transporter B member 14 n=1 Tax=Turnera subulata TaxID=218843 RepID=A0A9Q0JAQ3_9ROSI|nr:ABC transporter B member 14 [Turnera subulata]